MFRTFLGVLLAMGIAAPAFSADKYLCNRDDDADDWRINIDLKSLKCNLWDNDSNSEFLLQSQKESIPPVYVFHEKKTGCTIEFQESYDKDGGKARYLCDDESPVAFTCAPAKPPKKKKNK